MSAWTVYIDANHNGRLDAGEITALTNSSGTYSIAPAAAGTYQVRILPKTGYTITAPASGYRSVATTSGQIVIGKNFGEKVAT